MREDIRLILAEAIPDVEERVFEPSVPGANEEKPFIIVREGAQDSGDLYSNFATIVEVWPFVRQTSFQEVDRLSKKIIDTLHQKRFDSSKGEPFFVQYMGTAGDDVTDDEWDAYTRGLRLQAYSLAWMNNHTVEPDPVDAIQRWTALRFPELQTNPETWTPSDTMPGLYWRLGAITGVEPTNWGSWLTARLFGHVISPSGSNSTAWIKRLVEELARDRRTRLEDGSSMLFQTITADSSANPFSQGQIQLTIRFGVLNHLIDSELLESIHLETSDKGVS